MVAALELFYVEHWCNTLKSLCGALTQNKVFSTLDISHVNLHFCFDFYVSLKLVENVPLCND